MYVNLIQYCQDFGKAKYWVEKRGNDEDCTVGRVPWTVSWSLEDRREGLMDGDGEEEELLQHKGKAERQEDWGILNMLLIVNRLIC